MFRYIIDRVIALFITLFIIVSIAFCVVRLMPGSVYDQMEICHRPLLIL